MKYINSHVRDLLDHKRKVGENLFTVSSLINSRALVHDNSKLSEAEYHGFREATDQLAGLTYGSQEYKDAMKKMKPAIEHHYSVNRHHPEYFENGIDDMSIIDLIEMVCDWKAAVERHDNGDIQKSLDINVERFQINATLERLIRGLIEDLQKEV